MSLEEALAANTAALIKLCQLIGANELVSAQAAVAPSNTASSSSMHPRVLESPSDDAAVPTAQAPVGEPEAEDVPYEKVAAAVTRLANDKGREAAIAVLAQFNLKKLGEANTSDYPAILAACEAA